MESVSSSPTPPRYRFHPTQPVADRILRALRHNLRLLHHSQSTFFILGATGNVYTVTLSLTPSCSCPDRTTPCKHILFVYIRALGLSPDDICLRRRVLRPCQLSRLLNTPISPEALAGAGVRKMFHQLFFQARNDREGDRPVQVEDVGAATCPVCLEEMVLAGREERERERVVFCATCRNAIHERCLAMWKRSRGRRSTTCVVCRARWRVRMDPDRYLNLSAYVIEDDVSASSSSSTTALCRDY